METAATFIHVLDLDYFMLAEGMNSRGYHELGDRIQNDPWFVVFCPRVVKLYLLICAIYVYIYAKYVNRI